MSDTVPTASPAPGHAFEPLVGSDEWRQRCKQERAETRRRYTAVVAETIATASGPEASVEDLAEAVMAALFDHTDVVHGTACFDDCHPRLPVGDDRHDHGLDCFCQWTQERRDEERKRFKAEVEDRWSTPEALASKEQAESEEREFRAWVDTQPGLTVITHGGAAPEQWNGTVNGRRFYFRERDASFTIDLDGQEVAGGTINAPGYGKTQIERGQFIQRVIQQYLAANP